MRVAERPDSLPTQVTVPLEQVHQMVLSLRSDEPLNTYDLFYGIGAIQLKSLGNVKGISINQKSAILTKNNPSVVLKAVIVPEDAVNQNYTWSSSNPSVATVDENGVVRAVSKGTAKITVTTEEGGYQAECLIIVQLEQTQTLPPPANQGNPSTGNSSTENPGNTSVKAPSVSKVKKCKIKSGKKKLTVTWKKDSKNSGYQIQVSTKKNFKGASVKTVSGSKNRFVIKKLKSNRNYFVRIRAYKTYRSANGTMEKAYGQWVSIKKKTK